MKATRKDVFQPVSITIESQEELDILWLALNSAPKALISNASDGYSVSKDRAADIAYKVMPMWEAINNLYK